MSNLHRANILIFRFTTADQDTIKCIEFDIRYCVHVDIVIDVIVGGGIGLVKRYFIFTIPQHEEVHGHITHISAQSALRATACSVNNGPVDLSADSPLYIVMVHKDLTTSFCVVDRRFESGRH